MPQPSFGSFATCSGVDDNVLASRCIIFSLSATGCRNAALYGLWIIKLYVCADTLDKSIHPTAAAGGVCVCACASCCETINNSARRSWAINTSLICGVRARSQTRRRRWSSKIDPEHLNSPWKYSSVRRRVHRVTPPAVNASEKTLKLLLLASIELFIATVGFTSKRLLCAPYFDVSPTLFLLEIDQCFANLSKAGCAPQLQRVK
jgi:hypothetical protein